MINIINGARFAPFFLPYVQLDSLHPAWGSVYTALRFVFSAKGYCYVKAHSLPGDNFLVRIEIPPVISP
jgi:hypothetical protein